jgi:hypothetical protein
MIAETVMAPMRGGPPDDRPLEGHRSQHSQHSQHNLQNRMHLERQVRKVAVKANLDANQDEGVHHQPEP